MLFGRIFGIGIYIQRLQEPNLHVTEVNMGVGVRVTGISINHIKPPTPTNSNYKQEENK